MADADKPAGAGKRPKRMGRWTYNSASSLYGEAGWHLDGAHVVIDFMPGDRACCNGGRNCCRGCYLLYNWPRGLQFDGTSPPVYDCDPVARYLRDAMRLVEEAWHEAIFACWAASSAPDTDIRSAPAHRPQPDRPAEIELSARRGSLPPPTRIRRRGLRVRQRRA